MNNIIEELNKIKYEWLDKKNIMICGSKMEPQKGKTYQEHYHMYR